MKWLRKAKNSAILVDVILVVLLFGAAIGFASFVHLRNSNKPQTASAQETLSLQPKPESVLGEYTDASSPANDPNNSVGSSADNNNGESQPIPAIPAGTESTTPIAVVLPATPPLCDVLKKLQLKTTYDNNVTKENNRYEDAIKSLRILYPLLSGGKAQDLLNPEHTTNLTSLWDDYLKQLAAINCTL